MTFYRNLANIHIKESMCSTFDQGLSFNCIYKTENVYHYVITLDFVDHQFKAFLDNYVIYGL